ncbi:hypothetical protein Naga_101628g2 [Nannochloropsis gaditana]|uniref:Uncharacterized protein n=1 Tax=Nannochloropsis gaditana TaxID=72520 RepID=W7UCZ3_9STRA|nr:hypothetical protein Naga_101628g2 [Nannochloropsis gaditana]
MLRVVCRYVEHSFGEAQTLKYLPNRFSHKIQATTSLHAAFVTQTWELLVMFFASHSKSVERYSISWWLSFVAPAAHVAVALPQVLRHQASDRKIKRCESIRAHILKSKFIIFVRLLLL